MRQKYIINKSYTQYSNTMTNKEYKKLRSKLPRGYVRVLAKEAKVSAATVLRALRGDSFNQVIIDLAIKMAADHQQTIKNQQHQINSL
jgi:putative heme iron utilization protein